MEDHDMTPKNIKDKMDDIVYLDKYWRIIELLDKIEEIRIKGAKSKLRNQIEFIKTHTLYRPSSLSGSDEGGLMFKKLSQKYNLKSKSKKI